MTLTHTICPNHFSLYVGKQGMHSAEVGILASLFEKSPTELKHKQTLIKCKSMTFNIRTLNRTGELLELTASMSEHNIDIVCVQEHRYHHSQVEIKKHHSGNGWTFI